VLGQGGVADPKRVSDDGEIKFVNPAQESAYPKPNRLVHDPIEDSVRRRHEVALSETL
jgi:hypothetical protein